MVIIDGAIGWGQVLRTAIALSSLTLRSIKVINIRKSRPKPGLMTQHLMGVKIAGEFCNAEIKGLKLGSMEIEFLPKEIEIPEYKKVDIGTAGSIPLLLQTLAPILIFAEKPTTLEIVGGCAGLGSPTIEFIQNVTFPILSKLRLKIPEIEIVRQGYYPRGQGRVKVSFEPVKKLNSVDLLERGDVIRIKGISLCGSLPEHIATRQANSAKGVLSGHGFESEIESQVVKTASPGTSITLWAECKNTVLGADDIGERGKPAEKVGEEAAKGLIKSIESKAVLDRYMSDQIIPFIALAKGSSKITVEEVTQHCKTNVSVCEQILGVKFKVEGKKISVDGIGFQR